MRRALANQPVLRRTAATLGVLATCLLAGCGEQNRPERHEALLGSVESLRPDTGQLTVRASGFRPEVDGEQSIPCLLTSDAEVYVNDKFSGLDALVIGDRVELIGYRDPAPRAERFLVALARVRRSAPAVPPPDLPSPTTEPTPRSKES